MRAVGVFSLQMRCFVLAVVAWAAAGCGADCAQSADIQVTVAPNSDVDVAHVARLHVTLVVGDGAPRSLDITPTHVLGASGSTFILRPDPAPSAKYSVSVTVQAISSGAMLLAIGSESAMVVNKGCNRITVHLAALPIVPPADMASNSTDMAGVVPADMAGCVGGSPDEDQDGRANFCDVCPADSDPTPVDTDGDGLPDACDPDPTMVSNSNLYFDPFDVASGHWSGSNPVQNSYMLMDSAGSNVVLSSNGSDRLPLNMRVQTKIVVEGYYGGAIFPSTGIYAVTDPDPRSAAANGMLCAFACHSCGVAGTDTLDIVPVVGGVLGSSTSMPLPFATMPVEYRLRLTQRGSMWTCEGVAQGIGTATVTATLSVTGQIFMSLRAASLKPHIHSVVAETKLP
jgi:hypothetical protein